MELNLNKNKFFKLFYLLLFFQILVIFIKKVFLDMHYPHTTFLFDAGARFTDWIHPIISSFQANPYIWDGKIGNPSHFPVSYFYLSFFKFITRDYLTLIIIFIILNLSFYALSYKKFATDFNIKSLKNSFLIILLSHPVLFAIDRGSSDFLIFSSVLIFCSMYANKKYFLASIILALFALKGYTLAFSLIFFKKGQYKYFILAIGFFIILNIFALLSFDGHFFENLNLFFESLSRYNELYILGLMSANFYWDPYNMIRSFFVINSIDYNNISFLNYYHLFSLSVSFYLLYLIRKIPDSDFSLILLAITLLIIIFPDVSNIYKGVYILIPLILLINENKYKQNGWLIMILILLISPKNYWSFKANGVENNLDCFINPILIIFTLYQLKNVLNKKIYTLHEK
jgi:hypothetical protein